jgi:ribosomal-protein-alanine N-acetyltransferase
MTTYSKDVSEVAMNLTIRPARLEDLDAIMEIERNSFLIAWEHTAYLRICLAEGRVLSGDKDILFMDILVKEKKIIGYAVWETDNLSKKGHILNLAIIEEERREGHGKLLILHVQESLRNAGLTSCYLEVRESNSSARSLYETCGYLISDRLVGYYFDEDAIVYSRDL